jgi:hypothetical protein
MQPKRAHGRRFLKGGNPDRLKLLHDSTILMVRTSAGDGSSLYGRAKITCPGCQTVFSVPRSAAPYRAFCSVDCRRKVGWTPPPENGRRTREKKKYPKLYQTPPLVRAMKALRTLSKSTELTPKQAQRLRGKLAGAMDEILDEAIGVVMGHEGKSWTPTQARVFGILVGKVLPDLSASHVMHETRSSRPEDMSIDELENLIAEARAMALSDEDDSSGILIEHQPLQPSLEAEDDRHPEPEAADPIERDA